MPFAAAISEHPLATHAVGEVVGQVLEQLGEAPHAVVAFATRPFAGAFEDITATIRATLGPVALIGATVPSVIGGAQEVEGSAAVSLFALQVAAGSPTPTSVRLTARRDPGGWHLACDHDLDGAQGTLVVLAEEATFPAAALVADLARRAPDLLVVGTTAPADGAGALIADGGPVRTGAIGLLLPATLPAHAITSQGADPVGEPLVVTRAAGNLIEEIAGQAALDLLLAQADAAAPDDRRRMARGLHLGVAVDERKVELERGDFLVRPVLGGDKERRAVAVDAEVEVGTTVQFHVRDAASADADLRDLLVDAPGRAALLFTDLGRGRSLFGAPDHDAAIVHEHVEGGATAGAFGAAQIGPLGGRAGVHVRSATVLLLDDP